MSFMKRNDALNANPFQNTVSTDNHITVRGSDWYFAVTGIMMVSSIVFMGLSYTKHESQRLFHYITAAITLVASIAYFSMGANLGWTAIQVEYVRSDPRVSGLMRQIFYVRYIDWFVTTPLLLLDLLLTCGLPTPTIVYTILMNEIMIVTGLIGALVKSSYKWGYFVFGCVAFGFVAYTVVFEGRSHARVLGNDILKTYTICGVWTIGLWCLYPIAWAVSEGGNIISSDSEAVFYGLLDVLAKPVFGALLLWGHKDIDLARLGLHIESPADKAARNSGKRNGHELGYTMNDRSSKAHSHTSRTSTSRNGNTPNHNATTV